MPSLKALSLVAFFVGLLMPTPIIASVNAQNDRLRFDTPVVDILAAGSEAIWQFEGQANQQIALSAERYPPNPDSNLDPLIELYAPDGTLIATDDDSSRGQDAILLNISLPDDGLYTVLVRNLADFQSDSYQLTLSENTLPVGCASPAGEWVAGYMPSQMTFDVRYRVFLPPCHETIGVQYPYILLMHGSNSDDRHWDMLGIDEAVVRGVALGRLPPVALVLPYGAQLANTNTFNINASWEYVVINELVPFVESNFCLQNTRNGRAIGGISRGGFWAFLIAFRHPQLFGALGGHSPFFDLYHAPPSHNPLDLAQAPPPDPAFRLWMDRGSQDYALLNIDRQHDHLTANGIDHTYKLYASGRHENAYWSAHVDDYLAFYTKNWNPDTYPTCMLVGEHSS